MRDMLKCLKKATPEDVTSFDKEFVQVFKLGTDEERTEFGYVRLNDAGLPAFSMLKNVNGEVKDASGNVICMPEEVAHEWLVPNRELLDAYGYHERLIECGVADVRDKIKAYLEVPNWSIVTRDILDIVAKHQVYLCKKENWEQLAYIMMRWINLYYAGRIVYGYGDYKNPKRDYYGYCENNPKYEIEDLAETEKRNDAIYDAWCVGSEAYKHLHKDRRWFEYDHMNLTEDDFNSMVPPDDHDEFNVLLYKKNKTMDDWYALLGDPRYEYHSIYETKKRIDDHLLCVIGNGYDWNKEGFLCHDRPSGNDEDDYGSFYCAKKKLRADIRKKLFDILDSEAVQKLQNDAKDKTRGYWEDKIRKDYADRLKWVALVGKKDVVEETTVEGMVKFLIGYHNDLNKWSNERKKEDDAGEYYSICKYSAIKRIPKNVHISYVKASIRILQDILDNADKMRAKLEVAKSNTNKHNIMSHHASNIKIADALIKKWKKKEMELTKI